MYKNCILILSLLGLTFSNFAQTIPASRSIDWTTAGYQGQTPLTSNVVDVKTFGAVGDGVADDHQAFTDAINSLNGALGIISVPPGTYKISNTLVMADSVILRGAASDSTFLKFDLGGNNLDCISATEQISGGFTDITAGTEKGSTVLTVDDGTRIQAGSWAEIRQDNGNWDVAPASWATHSIGMIVKVTDVQGNVVTLESALRMDLDPASGLEIRSFDPIEMVGIECLNIERVDNAIDASAFNIKFKHAVNCWVTGVESNKSVGSHIMLRESARVLISGCYIHDAFSYNGEFNHGSGITVRKHASENLIENNVFRNLRHAVTIKEGANGNVYAYNYSLEPNRPEAPNDGSGDIALSGHFPYANLFEGNIGQNIIIDHNNGPAGPFNTFFRNRAELFGLIMTADWSDSCNFVGNEITHEGQNTGNFALNGDGHLSHGNNVNGTITPAGTSTIPESSLFLSNQPRYWDIPDSWPSIGLSTSFNTGTIPAKERFLGSTYTDCQGVPSISSIDEIEGLTDFQLFPVPVQDELNLSINSLKNLETHIQVMSAAGQVVSERSLELNYGSSLIRFNTGDYANGLYFVLVSNNQSISKQSFVISR